MDHQATANAHEIHPARERYGAIMEAIETIHKRIEVFKTTFGAYGVKVWLGNKVDAKYGFGSKSWAIGLAKAIAKNDDVREYLKQSQDLDEVNNCVKEIFEALKIVNDAPA